jgi:predicted dehydrogenase
MKIVIGYGYWGQIIVSTLEKMGFGDIEDIFVCDPKIHQPKHPHYMEYRKIPVTPEDDVFIATPVKWHYSVAQYFLAKGVNVFCEKPLCYNLMDAKTLYGYAKDSHLFVDWTFVYNIQVKRSRLFT